MEYTEITRAAFVGSFAGCFTCYLLSLAVKYLETRQHSINVDPIKPREEDDGLRTDSFFKEQVKKYTPKPSGKRISPKIQTDAKAAAFERAEAEKALMKMGDEP